MRKLAKTISLAITFIMLICSATIPAFAASNSEYKYEYTNWYARSVHRYTVKDKPTSYYLPATYLLENGSEKFPAYCVDLHISAVKGKKYKRLNLEDVTYFKNSDDSAKVRAIVNEGFWPDDTAKTLDALRKATNKPSLTASEALAGTQLAIWEYGNSGSTEIDSYYACSLAMEKTSAFGTYQTASGVGNNANEHGDINNSYSATTNSNIMAVRSYLLSLAPRFQSSADVIFNDSHFVTGYKLTSSDGSNVNGYEVTIAFSLASTSTDGNLVLTATQNGNKVYSGSLKNVSCVNNTYTLTFKTYDITKDIELSLKGTQNLPDSVYFYQAEDMTKSQSFVGKGSGVTEVDASAVINMKNIEVAPHNYIGKVTKEPTCTEKGEKTYVCENDSNHKYTEEIPAKGHTPVTDEAVEPTCTEIGYTEGSHCSECGEVLVLQQTVDEKGHDYEEVVIKEPTCTEKGEKEYVCKNDSAHNYIEEIPAKGHIVVIDEAVEATSKKTGLTQGSHCSECGKIIVEQKIVAAVKTEQKTTQTIKNDVNGSSNNSNKNTTSGKSTSKKSPNTGCDYNASYAALIVALSSFGLITCIKSVKKKNDNMQVG